MIALDAALRKLTVCQLTHESRGNGGGLRPRVLCLRAAAGGSWTRMKSYNWKAKPISPCLGALVGEKPLFLRRAPLLAFRAMTTANTADTNSWRGRAHADAGGALGISITSIERALEWRSKFSRALPSGAIIQRQAAALGYSLLRQSNHAVVTTRGGVWHTLGAILCGDQQADLFDYLREFKDDFPEQTETYLK